MFPLKDNIPLARFPIVTVALVAINVIAYLLAIRHGGSFFGGPSRAVAVHYGAIPYELTHPGTHCDLVSVPSARRHRRHGVACQGTAGRLRRRARAAGDLGDGVHLDVPPRQLPAHLRQHAVPGDLRPHRRGRDGARCASWPSTCSAASSALGAQVLVDPDSIVPTLGASGAIAAVLGGYIAAVSPRARPQPRVHRLLRHDRRGSGARPARLLVRAPARASARPGWPARSAAAKASPTSPTSAASRSACSLIRLFASAPHAAAAAAARCTESDDGPPVAPTRHEPPARARPGARVHRRLRVPHVRRGGRTGLHRWPACSRSLSSCCSASGSSGARCRNPPR